MILQCTTDEQQQTTLFICNAAYDRFSSYMFTAFISHCCFPVIWLLHAWNRIISYCRTRVRDGFGPTVYDCYRCSRITTTNTIDTAMNVCCCSHIYSAVLRSLQPDPTANFLQHLCFSHSLPVVDSPAASAATKNDGITPRACPPEYSQLHAVVSPGRAMQPSNSAELS